MIGLLSMQLDTTIDQSTENLHSISIFKAQLEYHNNLNALHDKTYNDFHPLSFVASAANEDVIYYDQAMQQVMPVQEGRDSRGSVRSSMHIV